MKTSLNKILDFLPFFKSMPIKANVSPIKSDPFEVQAKVIERKPISMDGRALRSLSRQMRWKVVSDINHQP